MGNFRLVATRQGLCQIQFPLRKERFRGPREKNFPSWLVTAARAISDYFSARDSGRDTLTAFRQAARQGKALSKIPLDLSALSRFQRRVLKGCRRIGYGSRISYKDLSARIGSAKGARAVGRALAANPIPIAIPCHRVVRSDGHLGGYAQGVAWKKRLLALERWKVPGR